MVEYLSVSPDGFEEANRWKGEIEKTTQQNYDQINKIVKIGTNGKIERYNPKLLPKEQGLPDMMPELQRVGLIK